jgi:UDP-N-acetylglucosamine transferase subunit ALG13
VRREGVLIFLTVGAQMPFDRLARLVDDWAGAIGRDDVVAQLGPTAFEPRHLKVVPFLEPPEFRQTNEKADAVVAHAGMGTILSVLELGRPLLVMPRLAALGETRNDHQVATARYFAQQGLVLAAFSDEELVAQLGLVESQASRPRIGVRGSEALLQRIRSYALGGR